MGRPIHKKIVLDENNNPFEVIIKYNDWKKIEQALGSHPKSMIRKKLNKYVGILHIEEDPLDFQRRIRSEWR